MDKDKEKKENNGPTDCFIAAIRGLPRQFVYFLWSEADEEINNAHAPDLIEGLEYIINVDLFLHSLNKYYIHLKETYPLDTDEVILEKLKNESKNIKKLIKDSYPTELKNFLEYIK